MTQQHPITPPTELVQQWEEDWHHSKVKHIEPEPYIATRAAQWGADQELQACCEWLMLNGYGAAISRLRAARRPKPPSLKEQALAALNEIEDSYGGPSTQEILIRRALEALPDG
jgi:hypothetical protein